MFKLKGFRKLHRIGVVILRCGRVMNLFCLRARLLQFEDLHLVALLHFQRPNCQNQVIRIPVFEGQRVNLVRCFVFEHTALTGLVVDLDLFGLLRVCNTAKIELLRVIQQELLLYLLILLQLQKLVLLLQGGHLVHLMARWVRSCSRATRAFLGMCVLCRELLE